MMALLVSAGQARSIRHPLPVDHSPFQLGVLLVIELFSPAQMRKQGAYGITPG
jgi:hypothetical protein